MYCCAAANSFAICSLSAATKRSDGTARKLSTARRVPPEAGRLNRRFQRADGEAGRRLGQVVVGRGHVVRGVRVEQRGQVLDVAAARAQLELAAAVRSDPVLAAIVVGGEQLAQRPEARRLDVD